MMAHGPGRGPRRGGFGGPGRMMPAGPPKSAKDLWRALRLLVGRLRPERWWITAAAVLGSLGVAFTVAAPRIIGNATNVLFDGLIGKSLPAGISQAQAEAYLRLQGGQDRQIAQMLSGTTVIPGQGIQFNQLGVDLGVVALLFLLGAALSWGQGYIMAGVAQRTVSGMRRDVEAKLARLPLQYFDSHPHGDVLSRVTNDIDNVTTTLQQGLSQLLTSFLTILGVLVMMLTISWLLALISLVMVPMSIGVTFLVARRSQKHFAVQWERTGAVNSLVEQTHTGHTLVQVFGRSRKTLDDFDRENKALYEPSFRAQFLSGIIQPAMMFLSNLNYVAIGVIGGYLVVSGNISLGDIQAFIQYSRQFTNPIMQIASQMNLLQSGLASAERVFEFLAADEQVPERPHLAALPAPEGHVVLENVSFRYHPDKPLIQDFDLDVRPGETVAIVGPTGAGKTTIVNLLMRFYEIDSGHIYMDGVDARNLSRESIRSMFGMVLQDTWLFAGSVRDNIAYGKSGASFDEVVAAARAAHADHFIRTLPEGYDTVLDEDASNISAGERQLLTIARAFLADPAILILDEATSNVDTRTEVLIQEAMARLRHGRTSFVIAHRLSTIRNADEIVVMNAGRIVEQGSHAELMERRGFYHDLYASQFANALVEEAS
ncbi:MAG: ABC transporter ATP-binding protein [Candidatus Dormibacteria bacterium]|jgi:ATP-binding cassette subfamily B multidrug efflux pump|nr:multidrug ABC transporter ATP-binding protein [Chloroflexota bacterium]